MAAVLSAVCLGQYEPPSQADGFFPFGVEPTPVLPGPQPPGGLPPGEPNGPGPLPPPRRFGGSRDLIPPEEQIEPQYSPNKGDAFAPPDVRSLERQLRALEAREARAAQSWDSLHALVRDQSAELRALRADSEQKIARLEDQKLRVDQENTRLRDGMHAMQFDIRDMPQVMTPKFRGCPESGDLFLHCIFREHRSVETCVFQIVFLNSRGIKQHSFHKKNMLV